MNKSLENKYFPVFKKFGKIIGWCTTVGAFGFAIYAYFRPASPCLEYQIMDKSNVFTNKHNTSLRIFVDTIDVKEQKANLTMYQIRVCNTGHGTVTPNLYDEGRFGLLIHNGCVLEQSMMVASSNGHIEERYMVLKKPDESNFISIPPLTLDKGEFYEINFSVLHADSLNPSFETIGKIIGQEIIMIDFNSDEVDKSNIKEAVFGNFDVQLYRVVIYGFGLLISFFLLTLIIMGVVGVVELVVTRRRKYILMKYANWNIEQNVRKYYVEYGMSSLKSAHKLLNNTDAELTQKYQHFLMLVGKKAMYQTDVDGREYYFVRNMYRLKKYNLIDINGEDKIIILEKQKKSVRKLVNKLEQLEKQKF